MKTSDSIKIAILSYHFSDNSENRNSRPLLIYKAIKEWKPEAEIKIYCSAFDHIKKMFIDLEEYDFIPIKVPAYFRNISLERLFSYQIFALKLLVQSFVRQSDLIIVCVPTNSPLLTALLYKIFWEIPLVVDIIDLWPEALPLSPKLKTIINPLTQWLIKPLRAFLYNQTDLIIAQSYYFRQKLGLSSEQCHVIPMSSANLHSQHQYKPEEQSIRQCIGLVYLGSINHIIDLDSLIQLVTLLSQSRSVHLSVIGGGEKLDYLKEALQETNITTTFYGICFDPSIKSKEFSIAHFGYNGYINSTEVALSYKSLEYFAHSLPLLNSAKGDTYELIETQKCGFNFSQSTINKLIENILELDDESYQKMRYQTGKIFDQTFSWPIFNEQVREKLKPFVS